MPLKIPTLDDRKYQDILREALARIPVHTREWTNFNESDPGVTIIEVFSFLAENLYYRANLIPERNRIKFLSLLGIHLLPGAASEGIVTFSNERGPFETITLNRDLEVFAEKIPFRTTLGLNVLPIECRVLYKKKLINPPAELKQYYDQLYTSWKGEQQSEELELYETRPLDEPSGKGVDLSETVGNSLWVALLARPNGNETVEEARKKVEEARKKIAGKTLSLGIAPQEQRTDIKRNLLPGHRKDEEGKPRLEFLIPKTSPEGTPRIDDGGNPVADYKSLEARPQTDVTLRPGIIQIVLPQKEEEIAYWTNLDPLEAGVGDFPPALEDTNLSARLITWIRVHASGAAKANIQWAGINAAPVKQRAHISNERLPAGTGAPDQTAFLSKTPVIADSVRLTVNSDVWERIDDLLSAGPEVPLTNPQYPFTSSAPKDKDSKVFTLNLESGEIRFGDGFRGARPPINAVIRADYDYGLGSAGNVGAGSIKKGPALPSGIKVTNPLPTWGGADPEKVSEGEKQISRYLGHRDRLVTLTDFETIASRTPGVDIGRVEIVPAFNPDLEQKEPGNAPGAVTIMVIPRYDAEQPDAPLPNRDFINAVCDHIDPRRLVTTEVFLRAPKYVPVWISMGISVVAGKSIAEVTEKVKRTILQYLSPLPAEYGSLLDVDSAKQFAQQYPELSKGWPLRNPVVAQQLLSVAARVTDVSMVHPRVLIATGSVDGNGQMTTSEKETIEMKGLELPRVMAISITSGEPVGLAGLVPGRTLPPSAKSGEVPAKTIPVPVIPEECR
jgi:hypothetical protein